MGKIEKGETGNRFYELATKAYGEGHYNKAVNLLKKASLIAKENKSHKLLIEITLFNAWICFFHGDHSQTLTLINESKNHADSCTSLKIKLNTYVKISDLYYQMMKYEESMNILFSVMSTLETRAFPEVEAKVDGLIARTRLNEGFYNISNYYLNRQLAFWNKSKRYSQSCETMINLSKNYSSMGDFNNSLYFLEQAYKIADKNSYLSHKAKILILQGEIHSILGDGKSVNLCLPQLAELSKRANFAIIDMRWPIYVCKLSLTFKFYKRALDKSLELYNQLKPSKTGRNIFTAELMLIIGQAYLGLDRYQDALDWFWKCIGYIFPNFANNNHLLFRSVESIGVATSYLSNGTDGFELLEFVNSTLSYKQTLFYRRHYSAQYYQLLDWKLEELLSRCKGSKISIFRRGIVAVDLQSGWVYKNNAEAFARLSKCQRKIFGLLVEKNGKIVLFKEILECVQYYSRHNHKEFTEGLARYYISQIRKKIEHNGDEIIITENGGYSIN